MSGWLSEHILKYPAEVIGAAWDESIGSGGGGRADRADGQRGQAGQRGGREKAGGASMALSLKVDRTTLEGHERTLVDAAFFDGRTETSTELVKAHYLDQGFNPVNEIRPELEASVQRFAARRATPRAHSGSRASSCSSSVSAPSSSRGSQGNLEPIGALCSRVWAL